MIGATVDEKKDVLQWSFDALERARLMCPYFVVDALPSNPDVPQKVRQDSIHHLIALVGTDIKRNSAFRIGGTTVRSGTLRSLALAQYAGNPVLIRLITALFNRPYSLLKPAPNKDNFK